MTIDTDELDVVAEIFEGLSNQSKLAILLGLDEEQSLKEIADLLEITQQGLEKNIDKMLEAGLVMQSQDGDQDYMLTPLGEYFIHVLQREWDTLVEAQEAVRAKEEVLRERVESGQQSLADEADGFTFQIDDNVWEHTVQTQKWVLAEEELRDILDIPAEDDSASR
jgi:DNA-binding MarR family transcriptional regulator